MHTLYIPTYLHRYLLTSTYTKQVDLVQKDHKCFRQFTIDCPAMKALLKTTLLLLYLPLSLSIDSYHITDEVLHFCAVNGFKFVALDALNHESAHYGRYISRMASSRGIRTRFLHLNDHFDQVEDMDMLVRITT